jgi:glucans biosynthesis protein
MLSRRDTLAGLALGATGAGVASRAVAEAAPLVVSQDLPVAEMVRARAVALASTPYIAPVQQVGAPAAWDYDQQRQVRFRSDRTRWTDDGSLVHLQYFPTGYAFRTPVELYEVIDGQVRPVVVDSADFDAPPELAAALTQILGVSGFRLQSQINTPGVYDEIAVFQGASYFRSLGRQELYGLSARAIALGTGEQGEEFPDFRAFWLERPAPGATTVVVHALLDGPSVAGAYRFTITPGEATMFEVEARLYPRRDITNGGAAPQTSMFLFGPADRSADPDFREAVHDSDGLEIWTSDGRRIWRPLVNPKAVQITRFQDTSPRGFGLMQRARKLDDYSDLEAQYERRPSLWMEPVGAWGEGAVVLVELPTEKEGDDNIAAFWRPAQPWKAGQGVRFDYRLYWGEGSPDANAPARVVQTRVGGVRTGGAIVGKDVQFVIDFAGLPTSAPGLQAVVSASTGATSPATLTPYPAPDQNGATMRAAFRFTPPAVGPADLELRLVGDAGDLSETWRFLWTR